MTIEDDKFKRRLARRLALAAQRRARPKVARASDTLARNMIVSTQRIPGARGDVAGKVSIPHYWALYVHDGRRPFRKQKFMVWFRNPRLDPRLVNGKTPKRASQLRSLTRAQWLAAVRLRDEWIKQGGDPFDAPVIITKAVRKSTKATPFFGNAPGEGMFGFIDDTHRIARAEMSRHVRKVMGDALFERDTAVATIR